MIWSKMRYSLDDDDDDDDDDDARCYKMMKDETSQKKKKRGLILVHSQSCHLSSTASRDSFRLYPCVGHLVTFVFPLPSKIDSLLTCVSRMKLNKFHKCSIYLKNLCLFEFKCMIMSISKFCREKKQNHRPFWHFSMCLPANIGASRKALGSL